MSQTYFQENFQPWMEEVDIIIYNHTGFHFDELPDQFDYSFHESVAV